MNFYYVIALVPLVVVDAVFDDMILIHFFSFLVNILLNAGLSVHLFVLFAGGPYNIHGH